MTRSDINILCIGAAHWDVIARADGPVPVGADVPGEVERRPGGVAMNVALGLATQGCAVGLCAVVGDDEPGDALLREVASAGVDCTPMVRVTGATTDAYVAIEDQTGALVAAVADAGLLEGNVSTVVELASNLRNCIQTAVLDANLPASAIRQIVGLATAADVEIIANPVSPSKAPNLAPLLSRNHHATIVANILEAGRLTGREHGNAGEAATALIEQGAACALVTDGPRSAALATMGTVFEATPGALPERASVTGAGDALMAAFVASSDRRSDPQSALERALDAAARHMTKGARE